MGPRLDRADSAPVDPDLQWITRICSYYVPPKIESIPSFMKDKSKKPEKASKLPPIQSNVSTLDLDPDAWPKFEALVKSAARLGPKPHKTKRGA
jgi:hypothetical protein